MPFNCMDFLVSQNSEVNKSKSELFYCFWCCADVLINMFLSGAGKIGRISSSSLPGIIILC